MCRKEEQDVEGEAEETNKISMQFCAFCRLCQVQFSLMREKEKNTELEKRRLAQRFVILFVGLAEGFVSVCLSNLEKNTCG